MSAGSTPRVTRTRSGLCRRLDRWIRIQFLRHRISRLSRELITLRSHINADRRKQAIVHHIGLATPPEVLTRMHEEGGRLRDLIYQLSRANAELIEVEARS